MEEGEENNKGQQRAVKVDDQECGITPDFDFFIKGWSIPGRES